MLICHRFFIPRMKKSLFQSGDYVSGERFLSLCRSCIIEDRRSGSNRNRWCTRSKYRIFRGRSLRRHSVKNLLVPEAWIILSSSSRIYIYVYRRTRSGIQEIRISTLPAIFFSPFFSRIYWNISEKMLSVRVGRSPRVLVENFQPFR